MIATLTRKMAEDPTPFARTLPGLLVASLVPLLLIIQFDPGVALFYLLAAASILFSIFIAYLVGAVIGEHRNQSRAR